MKTIEEVTTEEEPCDQNVKSHDQVEKKAPLKQVTDQKNEYQQKRRRMIKRLRTTMGTTKKKIRRAYLEAN